MNNEDAYRLSVSVLIHCFLPPLLPPLRSLAPAQAVYAVLLLLLLPPPPPPPRHFRVVAVGLADSNDASLLLEIYHMLAVFGA